MIAIWEPLFVDYFEGNSKAQESLVEGLEKHFPETYQRWLTYQ